VPQSSFVQQTLDIAIGQPTNVRADDEGLEGSGADDAAHVWNQATDEPLDGAAYLWHGHADLTLGGLDRLAAAAVP
jgi:hypothetical protein